jgi:hypothetical protein
MQFKFYCCSITFPHIPTHNLSFEKLLNSLLLSVQVPRHQPSRHERLHLYIVLDVWRLRFCFSTGNTWQTVGDEFCWYCHNQCRLLVTKFMLYILITYWSSYILFDEGSETAQSNDCATTWMTEGSKLHYQQCRHFAVLRSFQTDSGTTNSIHLVTKRFRPFKVAGATSWSLTAICYRV